MLRKVLIEAPGGMSDAASPLVVDRVAINRAQYGRVLFCFIEVGWQSEARVKSDAVGGAGEGDVSCGDPVIVTELGQRGVGYLLLWFWAVELLEVEVGRCEVIREVVGGNGSIGRHSWGVRAGQLGDASGLIVVEIEFVELALFGVALIGSEEQGVRR